MHDMNEPIIVDPNTTVGPYSWECDAGMTTSYMNTNRDIMTDPFSQTVGPLDATDEPVVVDRKEQDPEGAGEGQTGDAGGDSEGQDFGQDQGEEDTMAAEGTIGDILDFGAGGFVNLAGLSLIGVGVFLAVNSLLSSRKN